MNQPRKISKAAEGLNAFEAAIVDAATAWNCFLRIGPFDRRRVDTATFPEARDAAAAMAAETQRPVMVYGHSEKMGQVMVGTVMPSGEFNKAVACDLPA